jgi:hypothetical protein
LKVQGFVVDDPSSEKADTYQSIQCTACRQIHLVNPKTGRALTAKIE